MRFILTALLFSVFSISTLAQSGLRGIIKTANGDAMPYAAISVKSTANTTNDRIQGTISNVEGRYELSLSPGQYVVVFQYLGFQAQQKTVDIGNGFTELNITLTEQVVRLQEVQAKSGNEDPAYTIMRRAIAKSRFHQLQVQDYTTRNYMKVSFLVKKLPAIANLFKKQLAEAEREANFKVGVPMLFETVSETAFQQPNTYRRRVIASRNSQLNQVASAAVSLGAGSFYAPKINGAASPLSPAAFSYYKFEYEGTFSEQGQEISKIRVIPRSWGEGVFRGVMYIIENSWAIHSFQLEQISGEGFLTNTRCTFAPIKNVWLPINFRGDITGAFYGVDFSAQFAVSQSFNQLTVNPAFVDDVPVIDEKKDRSASSLTKRDLKGKSFEETVKKQKELTTKNFKQLVKEYEKQQYRERKQQGKETQVVRNDSVVVDSLAGKRNVAFWDSLRSMPLTTAEAVSYRRLDSLVVVRVAKAKTDSVKAKKKEKFSVMSFLFTGYTFKTSPKTRLVWTTPLLNLHYNTVEGYHAEAGLRLNVLANRTDSLKNPAFFRREPRWYIGGTARYQFGRQAVIGSGFAGVHSKTVDAELLGGRQFVQFNPENPIGALLNDFTTLWFEQNFMKLYQKDFVGLNLNIKPTGDRLTLKIGAEYAQRSSVENFKEDIKSWIDWKNRSFTANTPYNAEFAGNYTDVPPGAPNAAFGQHNILTMNFLAKLNLGLIRYSVRNGVRRKIEDQDAPELTLNYRMGLTEAHNYGFAQATFAHSVETGIRSRFSYQVSAGTFLGNDTPYFPDFKHFAGNQFWFQQGDPVAVFRLLPYYEFSTGKRFLEAHALGEYRKLLLTQITWFRLLDLKENLFVHYLSTSSLKNYTEVGYGLNGLIPRVLPVFRVEVIGQFRDGNYQGLGYRVGTTVTFGR
jgi:Family of unknown function (DUF5686)/CarboxypepD_reg-like domain